MISFRFLYVFSLVFKGARPAFAFGNKIKNSHFCLKILQKQAKNWGKNRFQLVSGVLSTYMLVKIYNIESHHSWIHLIDIFSFVAFTFFFLSLIRGPYKRTYIAALDAYPWGCRARRECRSRQEQPRLPRQLYPGRGTWAGVDEVILVYPGTSSATAIAAIFVTWSYTPAQG